MTNDETQQQVDESHSTITHEETSISGRSGGVTSEGHEDSGTDEAALGRKPVVGRRKDGRNYVQKNSLTEAQLLAAREETRSNLKRKAKQELTEDDKKEDRRAANRLSAFQSRQRRKMIIEDLQKTVAEQSKHNADQGKEIAELKRQLQVARQENDMMRHRLATAGQAGFGGAQLFGGAGHMPGAGANPLLQLGQPQMTFQQNQLLQNAMLQNALLLSAQAQQQARGGNGMNTSNNVPGSQPANNHQGGNNPNNDPVAQNLTGTGTTYPQQAPQQEQQHHEQPQQQPQIGANNNATENSNVGTPNETAPATTVEMAV